MNLDPKMGNLHLRVGLGRATRVDKETGEIEERLPYSIPVWVFAKGDEIKMIAPLPQLYWYGMN